VSKRPEDPADMDVWRKVLTPSRLGAVLLAAFLLVALAGAAVAQDGEPPAGGGGDGQITGGNGDEQGEGEEGEEGEAQQGPHGRLRQSAGLSLNPGFHPTYKLTHDVDQDVSSWGHNFNLSYPLSGRIALRASSGITIRENAALNRKNRQEAWNAGLDIGVTSALTTGLTFNRTTQVDVRNEGASNQVRSFLERESVNLATAYKKMLLSGINVSLGATGGLENNKYADVRSKGSVQTINATLAYTAPLGVKTNFSYAGNHSLLDSEQGTLRSSDESISHNLNGHVDYTWMANQFTVDLGRATSTKEYPKEQQKERRGSDTESVDFAGTLKLIPDLDTKVGLSYSRNKASYALEPSKDTDNTTRSVNATLAYSLGATDFTAALRSEKTRDQYFSAETGNSYSQSIAATVAQGFGERLKASLRGRMGLLSHQYDDIVANDQDRDLFDREATLQMDYALRDDITTSLMLRVKEDQLIYIRSTRSGNNKVAQTYSVQPSVTKTLSPEVSVSQRYELSADYTFYTFNEDSNFLIRNFSITTGLDWRPFDPLKLGIEHRYRAQDEGAYVKDESGVEGYGKNSERTDNSMKIGLRYKLWGALDIDASQELSFQKKWSFSGGKRTFSWEKFDATLAGKASMDYELKDGSKLKLSVGRTHRDATSILDRQRKVWNIALSIDRTF
jgi:opacity protein-like surface antigen